MKRKFLNIISCFLALFIFVGSFVFRLSSSVLAASSLPDSWNDNVSDLSDYVDIVNNLKSNSSLSSVESGYYCISQLGSDYFIGVFSNFVSQKSFNSSYAGSSTAYYFSDYYFASISSVSQASSVSFSHSYFDNFTGSSTFLAFSINSNFYFVSSQSIVNNSLDYRAVYDVKYFKYYNYLYLPDYNLTGVIVGFDFSVEAFTQWLIDTGKYQELPAYIGTQKLKSFVQFYHDWGSSNSIFVIRLVEWLMHFNIAAQTIENRNIIKSTIDRLYQEYKNSAFVQINHDSSILPHHRKNIETNTTDDDLTLVTDDPSDDTLISILRDILRGVISIPNSIYDNTQVIIAKLDQLNHNIIISNNGGASSVTDLNPVLNKLDDIIDALGSDTVSVEIDQTTKDDTDDFFDDWNLQFSTVLNNKFPVASQLRTFFTGFFERCGIDADSDGEVYQYYNPGVLTASSVSRSAGTSSEDDIVTDFLGQFDNSDPSFLDDASFHGVPDLSVSVGGHSVSIIDFRVYAKYRDKIHFIISFVIWTLYLLHLYKALPSIIGQVADVATKTSEL